MTSRVSFAVCQCHGTRQPEASFRSTHAGPERGLPRRIAADVQLGMSGIGVNFIVCGFKVIISAVSAAWVGTGSPTAATAPSRMSRARIRFDRMVISSSLRQHWLCRANVSLSYPPRLGASVPWSQTSCQSATDAQPLVLQGEDREWTSVGLETLLELSGRESGPAARADE